jgi:DNA-binding transcriptional LysR family regulator
MINDLRAMAIFAETVKQGSFRGAAKLLDLSPSVVSYHITQLEQRLGTALIYRSTRKLSLTHEGKILLQHANTMLASAQQGLNEITADNNKPTGSLTITLPSGLTRAPISHQIAEFSLLYPGIALHILYTDVRQDIIADGIDLAVRAGTLSDSSLKSKRIGHIERKLVCSKTFWEKRSHNPTHPHQLSLWRWIKLAMLPNTRTLINADQQHEVVHFDSHVVVDSIEAMTQFCFLGLGLATPPSFLVRDALISGELVEVLPHWQVNSVPLYVVWPENVTANSNTWRLLDHLTKVHTK